MIKKIIFGILFPLQLFGQMEMWVARYDGPGGSNGFDGAYAIAVDDSGNVYVTGSSGDTSAMSWGDYATIKYNNLGDTVWVRRYDGPYNCADDALAIAVDKNGNVYVTGRSVSSETGYDYATVKYTNAGDEMWVRRYNYSNTSYNGDGAHAIAIDNSGNVYVTGESDGGTGSIYDYATIKYDSLGNTLWEKRYNGPDNKADAAYAITTDSNGDVYVTGVSPGLTDYLTIKYNSVGDTIWTRRYSGSAKSYDKTKGFTRGGGATAIAVDGDRNVYVTGSDWCGVDNKFDYATIKYNSAGDELWGRRYHGSDTGEDEATALAIDNNGNVYVTGKSYSGTSYDYATIKYDSSGDTVWIRRCNGPGNDVDCATGIVVDDSGNVYVTGYSDATASSYSEDYATIKYNSSGNEEWVQRYDGPQNNEDKAYDIALDNKGYVYVTGSSCGPTSYDYATVKYACVGVEEKQGTVNSNQLSVKVNPFINSTNIKYSVFTPGLVSLTIYNLTGTAVKTLVNEKKKSGNYEIGFSGKGLPAGIYFAKLTTENIQETKKLLLLK